MHTSFLLRYFVNSFISLLLLNSDLAGYKFGKTTDGQPGYIVPGGADTVIPFNRVINVTGALTGSANTVNLGWKPDLLYIEIGNSYEIKRVYTVYSGYSGDSFTVTSTGFTYNFVMPSNIPCRYRAVKFT